MISLQDKIQKFQKLLYNKQLDDFIPIDDQFIGGGVTMQSLIKQNSFILQEIKKMKDVFVNYCKLNQNVYEKINEHELALHVQTNKMNTLTTSVQRKMNDSIKQVKQMYEEMQYQSLRNKNLVQEKVRPIEEAIRQKVDQSSFSKQMKKILQQLDEDNDSIGGNVSSTSQFMQEGFRRKRGKNVGQQQYLIDKQKTSRAFLQLTRKIQKIDDRTHECENIIYKNTSKINQLILTVDNNQSQIYRINSDIKQIKTAASLTEQKLMTQIVSRTNDSVWQKRLTDFESLHVIPQLHSLSNQISRNQIFNTQKFSHLQPRFQSLNQAAYDLQNKNSQANSRIDYIIQDHTRTKQRIDKEIQIIEEKLKVLYKQKKIKIDKMQQKIDAQIVIRTQQIVNLKDIIKDLSQGIQLKVTVGVKREIFSKLTQFQQSVNNLGTRTDILQQQTHKCKGQIYNIKQVLSKKANFTDILIHFERKADKQDFKELKDKMESTSPSYLKSTIFDTTDKTRRTISSHSRRKNSANKNMRNPINIPNIDKQSLESDNEGSSRLFIMGLQNDLGFQNDHRRMSYTQSTRRRKTMKSTAGVAHMFQNY